MAPPTLDITIDSHKPPPAPAIPATSLRSGATRLMTGKASHILSQFGVVWIYGAVGSAADVGRYLLAMSICVPLMLLSNLQLPVIIASDHDNRYRPADYATVRAVASLIAMLIAMGLGVLAFPSLLPVLALVGLCKSIESFSNICCGYYQRCERFDLAANSMILRSVTMLVVSAAVFVSTHSLPASLLATALAWTLVMALFDFPTAKRIVHEYEASGPPLAIGSGSIANALAIAYTACPLGLAAGASSAELLVPRQVAALLLDDSAVGVLGVLSYFFLVGQLAVGALAISAIPRLSRLDTEHRFDLVIQIRNRLLAIAGSVALLTIAGVALGGRFLLEHLFGEPYSFHSQLLVPLAAATFPQYVNSVFSATLQACGRYRATLACHLAGLAFIGPACLFGGIYWGLVGIAWAIGGASWLTALTFTIVSSFVSLRRSAHAPSTLPHQTPAAETDSAPMLRGNRRAS